MMPANRVHRGAVELVLVRSGGAWGIRIFREP